MDKLRHLIWKFGTKLKNILEKEIISPLTLDSFFGEPSDFRYLLDKPTNFRSSISSDSWQPESNIHTLKYNPNGQFLRQKRDIQSRDDFAGTNQENIEEVLNSKLESYSDSLGGAIVSASFHDLHGKMPDFHINQGHKGWSASVIKIPVMVAVMRAIDEGNFKLSDELVVDHKYPLESYDFVTQMDEGETISIKELMDHMMVISDNEATNMLADHVGLRYLNSTMQELGATNTMLAHLLTADVPRIITDWNPEGSNLTTAEDLTKLLTSIYTNNAASRKSCKHMRNVLETGMGGPLAQYLPRETIIGNKIGYITDPFAGSDHHDASVINRDYVLTVMCNQIKHCINPFEGLDFDEVTEHWKKIKKTLDNYHQENDLPFYFTLFAEPHAHFKLGGSSGAMANISKVVHDVYYNGEVKL